MPARIQVQRAASMSGERDGYPLGVEPARIQAQGFVPAARPRAARAIV